ncbi:MAG: glutamate ligase domain-containing protein [Candidatus Limnocylindrales bacterium]
MPLLYAHLIPATFGGRARMNVANALAAAAAWAAGAHLHDIRQGLRIFSSSYFQAPGRLNLVEVGGAKVIIDYCHNVDGMRRLAEFVRLTMADDEARAGSRALTGRGAGARARSPRAGRGASSNGTSATAFGVIGIPGDRRDTDQRAYGQLAAGAFDVMYVREDRNLRGRPAGESAAHVLEGVAAAQGEGGGRVRSAEPVLDEQEAARRAMNEARPGDLVVICADDAAAVYAAAMALDRGARATAAATAISDPGELDVPEG